MNFVHIATAILALSSPGDVPHDTVLYDFRADWCGPCRSMDPVVGQLAAQGYPIRRVNIDQDRELSTRYGVQGIPCFVMVVNGKEVDRVVGATEAGRLEAMFSRNGVSPGVKAARGQSPDHNARQPGVPTLTAADAQSIPFPVSNRDPAIGVAASPQLPPRPRGEAAGRNPIGTVGASYDQLIRASVRLKIEDETGNSVGSGTIIDARAGEALIITCGHMFRDAGKDGRIWVDLFGPGAPHGVPGKLIDFDMKSEVGLLRIATDYPVAVAKLAPRGYKARTGDDVISVGCDGGADATVKETHVTSTNRYVGAPNLQVAFQPVQGRSGGGLFTPDGFVVGVCYAADPEANEGLFASLPALCDEIDRMGLAFISSDELGSLGKAAGGRRPTEMSDSTVEPPLQAVSTAATSMNRRPKNNRVERPLSADEQTAVEALRDKSQGAEVICIVRAGGDTKAKSEIIVLDHVSPDFVQRLAAERPAGASQRLTSLEVPRERISHSPIETVGSLPPQQTSKPMHSLPWESQPWWSDFLQP